MRRSSIPTPQPSRERVPAPVAGGRSRWLLAALAIAILTLLAASTGSGPARRRTPVAGRGAGAFPADDRYDGIGPGRSRAGQGSPSAAADPGIRVTGPAQYPAPDPGGTVGVDASPTDKVLHHLKARLLTQTHAAGRLTAACNAPISGTAAQQVTCTVGYDGLPVPFEVAVTPGPTVFTFRASQQRAVLVGTAVRDEWYRQVVADAQPGTIRCDASLPVTELVEFATATRYACSYRRAADGRRTVGVVVLQPAGVTFRLEQRR